MSVRPARQRRRVGVVAPTVLRRELHAVGGDGLSPAVAFFGAIFFSAFLAAGVLVSQCAARGLT